MMYNDRLMTNGYHLGVENYLLQGQERNQDV